LNFSQKEKQNKADFIHVFIPFMSGVIEFRRGSQRVLFQPFDQIALGKLNNKISIGTRKE
jgi:hypothetical protein